MLPSHMYFFQQLALSISFSQATWPSMKVLLVPLLWRAVLMSFDRPHQQFPAPRRLQPAACSSPKFTVREGYWYRVVLA